MSNSHHLFRPKSDRELRVGIRAFYYYVSLHAAEGRPILIQLPTAEWVSAGGLNMLLTFVEAVHLEQPNTRVFVDLLDHAIASQLLDPAARDVVDDDTTEAVVRKLIFFEAMGLIDLLRNTNVIPRPSANEIEALQDALEARKQRSRFLSTRMLSLTPLIETEEEQHALTTRIKTMTGILYKNLFGRIDVREMRDASNQIMFELVKNIYQHCGLPSSYSSRARGFACAQIHKWPDITDKDAPQEIVDAVLDTLKERIRGKQRSWLTITINDFGVGIAAKVEEVLGRLLTDKRVINVGRFRVDSAVLGDSSVLLQIAATTDFSSKTIRTPREDDVWTDGEEEIRLAARGYGLIYCVGFIARTYGRMQIRSGPTEITVIPKPDTPLKHQIWSNVEAASDELSRQFDDDFFLRVRGLGKADTSFPGTQIVIEVPVEVWPNPSDATSRDSRVRA